MTEMIDRNRRSKSSPQLQFSLIMAAVALILGATGGLIYGRHTSSESKQNSSIPIHEITVSNAQGLLFRSEDGTPLLKLEKDSWGTHLRLLSSDGKPLVELNNLQNTGGIVVGSKLGGFAYMQAQESAGTITLIGKYGKEAVQITSATSDGGGNLSINEGAKGYQAIEVGSGPNRSNTKGTIKIQGADAPVWQVP